jgi:uncharacterized membrane protein YheB (UPF0754 family)
MNIDLLSLPLIGAFIGYFTNYVAIKMLFLPKKPYYLFGIRIPFTPGLIPKKRKELIEKIANVVSSKVVNKKDIIKYIYRKKNRAFLYGFSENLINSFLKNNLSTLNINYEKLTPHIEQFLNKNTNKAKQYLSNINIDIDYFVYNAFLKIDKNKKIKEYLSKEQIGKIELLSQDLTQKAMIKLAHTMESDDIQELIKAKIKNALDKYSDDSNILMASIINMISPLIEDSETIPKLITTELQAILTDKIVTKKVSESVFASIEQEILNQNIDNALEKLGFENLDNIQKTVSQKLDKLIKTLSVKEKIIDSAIDKIDRHQIAIDIAKNIDQLSRKITFFDILNTLMPNTVKKLPSMAVNNLLFVLRKESEMIFNFDISKIAKEKLEKLDISDIEDVVLNISKDQFTHINIFGGLLGFIIGLTELIIR